MHTRRFALILGIVFLVVGVLGFIPGITQMHGEHGDLNIHGPGHGYLLGLFHVNLMHNLVHIVFGIAGIAMSRSFQNARGYARLVAISYALLAILGMIPAGNTYNLWGLVPLHGNDVWLHVLIAIPAAYFGFAHRSAVEDTHAGARTVG